MKNFVLMVLLSVFSYACKDCKETTVISFTEKDKEWFIYQEGTIFTYTNQKNDTLFYITEKIKDFPILYAPNRTQIFGNDCVERKWDGQRIKLQNITTKRDSIDIQLTKLADFNKSVYDGMMFRIYWYSNKYSRNLPNTPLLDSLNLMTYDTLNMQRLPYPYNTDNLLLKKITLRKGKMYDNVLVSQDWRFDDITKTSKPTTKIYYHKTTGIIRFETDNGDIWEL